jgi:hypothetical protein
MKNIENLRNSLNIGTGKFLLLTVATAGLYPIIWVLNAQKIIEDEAEQKIADKNYIIFLIGALGWSAYLGQFNDSTPVEFLVIIADLIYLGLYVYWSFQARTVIKRYALNNFNLDLKMNAFYTFIFSYFYINYCINDLPDSLKKQTVLMKNYVPQN